GLCEMTISGGTISGNTATYGAGIMSSHDVTLAGQPTIADQILLAATIFEETTSVNYPKINVRKTLVSSGTVIPVSLMEALHDADSLKFEVKAFETESFDDVDAHYYDKGHAVVSHVDGGLGMGSSGFQMAGGKAFYPLMSVADNYYAHAVTPNYYNTTIKNKAGSNLNSNIIVPENSKIVDNGDTIEVHYDYYQMIPTTNADGSTSYSESNKKTYVRSIRKAPTVSDFVFKDWYFGSSSTTLGTKIDTTIEVGELSGASNRYILPKYHQLFDIKIQHTVIFSGTLAAPTNYRVLKTETISDVEQTSAVYIYSAVGADSRDRIYQMTTTDPDTGVEGEKFLVSKENYVPSVMHYGVILSTGTSRYNGTKLTRTSSLSSDLTITVAYFNYVAMDENSYAYLNDAVTYPEDLYWSPNVVIPDAWFNDTVGVVDAVRGVAANGFQNCTFIENLTYAVDSNSGVSPVEVIGASAFEGCTNLKNIEIPEKVHSIGSRAFYNCSNVTTLNYNAKGVTDFARTNMIFSGLGASSDGVTINVGSYVVSIPYSFMNSSSSSYVKPKVTTLNITGADNLTTIKQFSFGNISTLTGNLYLPESLVTIGSNSFQYTKITGFDNLASSIVKRIANNSFAGCTSLSGELIFPSTLETLNNGAFSGCSGITKIDLSACTALSTLGDSLTVAGSCFNGCTNVSELKLNTSLLGDYSSNNTRFSGIGTGVSGGCKVYLGDAMTRVPAHLFSSCTGISSISFGSNIESIGGYAFYDNSSIVTLNLSGALKLTSIENSAFYRCNKITGTLNLSNVTNLGFSVFQYCSSITEVTLSSSLTVIPSYCFSGCSSISSIKIPTTVATIEECAFAACGLTELEIPNNVTSMGCGAFGDCTRLTNLTIGTGISYLETGSSASDYPAQFYGCTELEEITVYSTELSLRKKMFGGCAKLKTLVTLSGIASGGFSGLTYLETVEIYGVDYSIGENAFDSCTGLKSVWIASSGSGMGLTIGNLAFNGCYNLEKITFDGTRYDISGTGIISYIIVHTNSEAKNESPFWGCTKLTLYAHNIGFDTDSDWENNGYSSVTFIANDDKWKYVSDSKKVQGIN
ncbi:MAG: leucine-rich repeat domain-containing protein, partial [Clostridia bacterium]|nr:leucine-rich repeat domain-containing protein [Clostridia bacterium]